VPFQISCGSCSRCLAGQTACCETVPFRSSFGMAPLSGVDYGGALSDLLKVPFADHMLVPLPDAVSLAAAAGLADNVVDGYASVAPLLARMPGARVLVVGGLAQSVGLYAALAAKALGAEDVVYYDDDAERLALAARLGVTAQEADPERRDAPGGPFPIVVDASATAAGLSIALHSADLNGICHRCYGDFSRTTEVPLALMYNKGLTLHISRVDARARMPGALAHVCSGDLRPEELITTRAPFSEAAEAMLEPGIKLLLVAEGVDADG